MGSSPVNASKIVSLLNQKYSSAAWAFFAEVSNATGTSVCRRADGLAISLWPSRGLYFHGFEIKVSRRDWLNELKRPSKAEVIGKFCHYWWLVIGDRSIVEDGELPGGWGLQIAKGGKLVTVKEAPLLEPQPPTHGFVAAILRKFADAMTPTAIVDEQLDRERKEMILQVKSSEESRIRHLTNEVEGLRKSVDEFESESGIRINEYTGGQIGKAARLIADTQSFSHYVSHLSIARKQLARHVQRIDEAITELKNCDFPTTGS